MGCASASALDTPAELFNELFARAQLARVLPDGKTLPDSVPKRPPAQIIAEYRAAAARPDFDLRGFVLERFAPEPLRTTDYRTDPKQDVRDHIDQLWQVLTRQPDEPPPYSSRLRLPHAYVVPGGRYLEIYYWDSYFTMLGLEESRRHDLTVDMLRNFAWLIDQYGFVPNGNRTYYLSRSQPPFFAAMVELVAERDGKQVYATYLPQLRREYAFWMDGAAQLAPGTAQRRAVRMDDGSLLNRYWDDRDVPREEAYREDVETARASKRPAAEVYRELRAAAESGWDFSSRWLADEHTLATIHTTDIIPPDLNSLLYQLEQTIAVACGVADDAACVREMRARAAARKAAIDRYLWNADVKAFTDYDWRARHKSPRVTLAALYPLFVRLSNSEQARAVASVTYAQLLQPHGLATTTVHTDQQWDASNGWAPLHWIAIRGLRNYREGALAAIIARRWVKTGLTLFRSSGKLVEKYDVSAAGGGGGGEYPLQDGFGWTNGVLRKLLSLYPELLHPARPASTDD